MVGRMPGIKPRAICTVDVCIDFCERKGHMRVLRQTLILFAFTFVSVVVASAQTATGEVNGTVSDPNGAAVSGAAVKLINQATKTESETTTNQSGYFTFVNLKPASYVL